MVGIIGAMEEEVQDLVSALEVHKEYDLSNGLHLYQGTLSGKECIVTRCGMGKVFAAMATQTLIDRGADIILNVGVAGTLSEEVGVFDVVIADKVFQHDFDLTPIGFSTCLNPDLGVVYIPTDKEVTKELLDGCSKLNLSHLFTGTIATGDQFSTHDIKINIKKNFPDAIAIDMESAAVGQICHVNHIPFGIIRIISNPEGNSDNFWNFKDKACESILQIVREYLTKC